MNLSELRGKLADVELLRYQYFENTIRPDAGLACPLGWMIRWLPDTQRKACYKALKGASLVFERNSLPIVEPALTPVAEALEAVYGLSREELTKLQRIADRGGKAEVLIYLKELEDAGKHRR